MRGVIDGAVGVRGGLPTKGDKAAFVWTIGPIAREEGTPVGLGEDAVGLVGDFACGFSRGFVVGEIRCAKVRRNGEQASVKQGRIDSADDVFEAAGMRAAGSAIEVVLEEAGVADAGVAFEYIEDELGAFEGLFFGDPATGDADGECGELEPDARDADGGDAGAIRDHACGWIARVPEEVEGAVLNLSKKICVLVREGKGRPSNGLRSRDDDVGGCERDCSRSSFFWNGQSRGRLRTRRRGKNAGNRGKAQSCAGLNKFGKSVHVFHFHENDKTKGHQSKHLYRWTEGNMKLKQGGRGKKSKMETLTSYHIRGPKP